MWGQAATVARRGSSSLGVIIPPVSLETPGESDTNGSDVGRGKVLWPGARGRVVERLSWRSIGGDLGFVVEEWSSWGNVSSSDGREK